MSSLGSDFPGYNSESLSPQITLRLFYLSKLFYSSKRSLSSLRFHWAKKKKVSGCPYVRFRHNEGQNLALFLAERPQREKLSHRSPHTIVDALSKFELHRCLLRCVRECKGVGDVGPKFETNLGVRGAREYFILLVLDRLSRKLDASCTVVKNC